MRQIWITKRGGPEVLQVREAADPVPKEGEVRIRVAAAGVNFADVLARMGLYPDAPPLPAGAAVPRLAAARRMQQLVKLQDPAQERLACLQIRGSRQRDDQVLRALGDRGRQPLRLQPIDHVERED